MTKEKKLDDFIRHVSMTDEERAVRILGEILEETRALRAKEMAEKP